MYIMKLTRDGKTHEILASGWTQAEESRAQEAYESEGYTVTFYYGVWR